MAIVAGAKGAGFKEPLVFAQGNGYRDRYRYRNGLGMMPSAEYNVFHDDFNQLITTNAPTGWVAVIDTGATIVADTTVGHSSSLLFDSDGATEGAVIYMPEGLQLTSGKKMFMEVRFKTEVADDSDVQFGLSDLTAVTNPEDLWTTTAASLVAFGVLDGDATVTMLADKSNTGSSAELGTIDLTSATWHTLAIAYDGLALTGWVDGNLALTWSVAAAIPTGVTLAPFVGFRNGSAATTEGHCDYIRYVFER